MNVIKKSGMIKLVMTNKIAIEISKNIYTQNP